MTLNTPSLQSGPVLDRTTLQELNPFDEPAAKTKQPVEATAAVDTTAVAGALQELTFATCASLDDEQMPVCRSSRIRQPSVRLRDPDNRKTHSKRPRRGKADHIPRRRTPVPVDVPPHEPQPNQLASTTVAVWSKGNDTDLSANKPTVASFSADDVLLEGAK